MQKQKEKSGAESAHLQTRSSEEAVSLWATICEYIQAKLFLLNKHKCFVFLQVKLC